MLIDLVESRRAKSDADIATELNAQSITISDPTRWHSDGLAKYIGPQLFGVLDVVLSNAPGLGWVRIAMASERGLPFNEPDMQEGIEALRPALRTALGSHEFGDVTDDGK